MHALDATEYLHRIDSVKGIEFDLKKTKNVCQKFGWQLIGNSYSPDAFSKYQLLLDIDFHQIIDRHFVINPEHPYCLHSFWL